MPKFSQRTDGAAIAVFERAQQAGESVTMGLVKRVIALPDDRIHLHAGHVVLNGSAVAEPFAVYSAAESSSYRDEFPTLQRARGGVVEKSLTDIRAEKAQGRGALTPQEACFASPACLL